MTQGEILKKIVDAEQRSNEIYDEAARLQSGFDDYIKAHVEKYRREAYEKADMEIAAAKAEAKARADAAVAELDKRQEYEMSHAKAVFEAQRAAVIEKMYGLVVEENA